MNKIHKVLISSRAAIDLASIMVGIIIIGLIGGVIAATVFAVIPWSQDKAAKQQLESVQTAENAFFGLSSDANVSLKKADGTVGSFRNSFTGSGELAANELLSLNKEGLFCVIATSDGNDYHAYAKSGSGKWFSATNSKKIPVEYTGSAPCVTSTVTPIGSGTQTPGTVDTGVDTGSGQVPTIPVSGTAPGSGTAPDSGTTPTPTPTVNPGPTVVATYDFEDGTTQGFTVGSSNRAQTINSSTTKHSGKYALYYYGDGDSDDITRYFSTTVPVIEAGSQYRVTAWVMKSDRYNTWSVPSISAFGTSPGTTATQLNVWTQVSFTVKPTVSTKGVVNKTLSFNNRVAAYNTATIYVDDITIEKIS